MRVVRDPRCPADRPYAVLDDANNVIACHVTRAEAQLRDVNKNSSASGASAPPARRLRRLQLTKVDLVDRGADEHARVAIWKRAPEVPGSEETDMGLKKDELDALPEAVRKHIDALEATAADEAAKREAAEQALADVQQNENDEEEDDITKRDDLDPRVMEAITKRDEQIAMLEKRAEAAETVAKAEQLERRKRETREKLEKAELDAEALESTVTDIIELEDAGKESIAKSLIERYTSLAEQARTAALFEDVGKSMPAVGSASAKLDTIAKAYRDTDPTLTEAQAMTRAVDANPDLFRQTLTEA